MTGPSFRTSKRLLPITVAGLSLVLVAIVIYWSGPLQCDPQQAEATLTTLADQGVQGTSHPPSLSNLLWVHVGPQWHALSLAEKKTLDRVVRCAATTPDEQGRPTWQAAYYDNATGTIVALTSRQYGFRLNQSD